jgi:hypothetical protein
MQPSVIVLETLKNIGVVVQTKTYLCPYGVV